MVCLSILARARTRRLEWCDVEGDRREGEDRGLPPGSTAARLAPLGGGRAQTPPPVVAAAGGQVVSGAVAQRAPAVRTDALSLSGGPGRRLVRARARRYPPPTTCVAAG